MRDGSGFDVCGDRAVARASRKIGLADGLHAAFPSARHRHAADRGDPA